MENGGTYPIAYDALGSETSDNVNTMAYGARELMGSVHFLIALLTVALTTLSCSTDSDQAPPEPSQQYLMQNFRVHRQQFEYMRSLANRKPRITGIFELDQPIYGETPSGNVPLNDKRVAILRRAMNDLHVLWLRNVGNVITFTVWLGPASLKDRMSKGIA